MKRWPSCPIWLQDRDELPWCWGISPLVCGRCLWWSLLCLLLPPACPLYLLGGEELLLSGTTDDLLYSTKCVMYLNSGNKIYILWKSFFSELSNLTVKILYLYSLFCYHHDSLALSSYRRTAPGSLRLWCRSEPGDCSGYGTGPGCVSWGSRSSGARPRPHVTLVNRSERWWVCGQSQLRELSRHPPAQKENKHLVNMILLRNSNLVSVLPL